MTYAGKLIGTTAVVAVIAVGMVLTFTLAQNADGDVQALPIVQGEPAPLG